MAKTAFKVEYTFHCDTDLNQRVISQLAAYAAAVLLDLAIDSSEDEELARAMASIQKVGFALIGVLKDG